MRYCFSWRIQISNATPEVLTENLGGSAKVEAFTRAVVQESLCFL